MFFGSLPLDQAIGHILGHNVVDEKGRRILRKGQALGAQDIELLHKAGRRSVYVARLDPGDVGEDEAAERITRAAVGGPLRLTGPRTGRVNLHAETLGVVRIDKDRLDRLNQLEGVALGTVRQHSVTDRGRMVGTTKILPYALPETIVAKAEEIGLGAPIVELVPLEARRAQLIVTASEASRDKIVASFDSALRRRLEALGATLEEVLFVPFQEETVAPLADAVRKALAATPDLLVLAGETAIQDRHDVAPTAIESAGGTIVAFGAPVDPGNLLLLAYHGDVPIVGAPGCARSPKRNIVDWVLPRLLIGEKLEQRDLTTLGEGGLLEDVPERPLPRSRI